MKSPYYVATVVNTYRKRLDALKTGTADDMQLALLRRELNAASHRPYSSGFYFGELKHHAPDEGASLQDCTFVGVVRERLSGGRILFECRNRIREGDRLKTIVIYTKMCRGEMTRHILKNRITDPAALQAFEWEGFRFDPSLSRGDDWTFTM